MSWVLENICSALSELMNSTIAYFGDFIGNIFYDTVNLNLQNEYVMSANNFLIGLALALVSIVVGKQVLDGYILETNYDSDADPFDLVVRIAETCAVITCSSWIFNYVLKLSKTFSEDLLGSTAVIGVDGQLQTLIDINPEDIGISLIAYLLTLQILIIAFIVFSVVAILRAAELIAMKLLMPLFAIDLLTTNRERWSNFFTGYMIAFFSYGIQMLFFNIAVKSLMSVTWDSVFYMLGAFAWLYLAIKAPKFLEKYLYASGMSRAASGGLRMVAQVALTKAV